MFELTAARLASWIDGELVGGFLTSKIKGVSTDSRTIKPGELFIPLRGESFDGHEHIGGAVEAGAVGFITEKLNGQTSKALSSGSFAIKVDDSLVALQRLACAYRRTLKANVVAITGSTGKTSAREMTSAILGRAYDVVASEKNFNNEIGLPLTILSATPETQVVIVEMAMRGPGQIAQLSKIAKPDIGLVTGIGRTHIELLGSEEAIAEAKAELIAALPYDGIAILNADDVWTPILASKTKASVRTFGMKDADLTAEGITVDELGRPSFRMVGKDVTTQVSLLISGRHHVYNALAAASVAIALGMDAQAIAAGLAEAGLPEMRMEITLTGSGVRIVNDAYNANPDSMRAGLAALADIVTAGKRIAVLGDMLELGSVAEESHLAIGEFAAETGVDYLVTVGRLGLLIAEGARRAGMSADRIASFDSSDEAGRHLVETVAPPDLVFVKASRGMQLENIVSVLA